MPGRYCAAKWCINSSETPGISLFRFSTDDDRFLHQFIGASQKRKRLRSSSFCASDGSSALSSVPQEFFHSSEEICHDTPFPIVESPSGPHQEQFVPSTPSPVHCSCPTILPSAAAVLSKVMHNVQHLKSRHVSCLTRSTTMNLGSPRLFGDPWQTGPFPGMNEYSSIPTTRIKA